MCVGAEATTNNGATTEVTSEVPEASSNEGMQSPLPPEDDMTMGAEEDPTRISSNKNGGTGLLVVSDEDSEPSYGMVSHSHKISSPTHHHTHHNTSSNDSDHYPSFKREPII